MTLTEDQWEATTMALQAENDALRAQVAGLEAALELYRKAFETEEKYHSMRLDGHRNVNEAFGAAHRARVAAAPDADREAELAFKRRVDAVWGNIAADDPTVRREDVEATLRARDAVREGE